LTVTAASCEVAFRSGEEMSPAEQGDGRLKTEALTLIAPYKCPGFSPPNKQGHYYGNDEKSCDLIPAKEDAPP
jgi:hypothetical protein